MLQTGGKRRRPSQLHRETEHRNTRTKSIRSQYTVNITVYVRSKPCMSEMSPFSDARNATEAELKALKDGGIFS